MYSIVLFIYGVFVAFMSLRPADGSVIEPWDKLAHFITYAVFAVLARQAVGSERSFLYACLGIIGYGGLMELGQSYIPGRVMSGWDMAANTSGVVIAASVLTRTRRPLAGR